MLSRTSEYALMAVVYLTRHEEEWPIPGRQIAEELGIPRKYLSNVLRELVRTGVLEASPGKSGGFRMRRDPKTVRLKEVLAPFESATMSRENCPFGNPVCNDEDPCAGHGRWRHIKEAYHHFIDETSVYEVSIAQSAQPLQINVEECTRPKDE